MNRSWIPFRVVVAAILSVSTGTILADDEENETKIKFAEAPAAVQKTIQQEAGGAKVEELTKETEAEKTSYEAVVTINGKVYEIEVAEDGTLLEKKLKDGDDKDDDDEIEIKLADAPAAVQKTLKREAGGASIDKIAKETEEGETIYEAEVKIDGRVYEIEVAADGILQAKQLKDEEEVAMKLADCPAAVQKTLKREAAGAAIEKVDKESRDGRTIYEADVKIDGRNYEVLVADDGLLISKLLDEEEEEEGVADQKRGATKEKSKVKQGRKGEDDEEDDDD